MTQMEEATKYADEQEDRKLLSALYNFNESYRETARDFEVLRGPRLHPSMVRLLINGYEPGKKIRKVLNWPPTETMPVCAVHGIVHCYDCSTEQVKPRSNGIQPKRKPTSKIVSVGKVTPEQDARIMALTPAERLAKLLD